MNKHYLQSKVKSTGVAYLFWFLLGAHYAYLGKWGLQILFWITLGGLGLWWIIDLFTMPGKVNNYNSDIFRQLDEIEMREKAEEHARNMEMMSAASGNKNQNDKN